MKALSTGDVISTSKPFAYVISGPCKGSVCECCAKHEPASLKKCTRCHFAYYCGKDCQRKAWVDHKLECESLVKVHPRVPPPHILFMARIIRKINRVGNEEVERMGNIVRSFADLMTHEDKFKADKTHREKVEVAHVVLNRFLHQHEAISRDMTFTIYGKMLINSVSILQGSVCIGTGIYLGPSALNHSCHPNVAVAYDGPLMKLISLADHNEMDVSKLFISYIGTLEITSKRKAALREQYFFECDCTLCKDEWTDALKHSVRCENEQCISPVIAQQEKCQNCGVDASPERFRSSQFHIDILENELAVLRKQKTASEIDIATIQNVQAGIQNAKKVLHPFNAYLIDAMNETFDALITRGFPEMALEYGLGTLEGFRKYGDPGNIGLAEQLAKVGKLQLYLGKTEEAKSSLAEATKYLKRLPKMTLHDEVKDMFTAIRK